MIASCVYTVMQTLTENLEATSAEAEASAIMSANAQADVSRLTEELAACQKTLKQRTAQVRDTCFSKSLLLHRYR